MNKIQLLNKLENAWKALLSSYEGLPEHLMLESGVTGDWSVRDIIAHVTWWEEETLQHLPLILAGGRPPKYSVTYGGIDAFNAQMTEERQQLSLGEVLKQRDDTHWRLITYIQSVPEEQGAGDARFRKRLRLDTYGHYPAHTEAIRKWREGMNKKRTTEI